MPWCIIIYKNLFASYDTLSLVFCKTSNIMANLRLLWWCWWGFSSSRMWCFVAAWVVSSVSKVHIAFIFRGRWRHSSPSKSQEPLPKWHSITSWKTWSLVKKIMWNVQQCEPSSIPSKSENCTLWAQHTSISFVFLMLQVFVFIALLIHLKVSAFPSLMCWIVCWQCVQLGCYSTGDFPTCLIPHSFFSVNKRGLKINTRILL